MSREQIARGIASTTNSIGLLTQRLKALYIERDKLNTKDRLSDKRNKDNN